MKCQKMKKYLYRGLSVFMGLYLSLCSCIGSYASDSTSSGATDTWEMPSSDFLSYCWLAFAKMVSSPYVVWNELTGCTYSGFENWLTTFENGDHYHLLTDGTVIGHGGAGFSRDIDKINNSEEIDVNPELKQYVLNYIQYCTTQTDLTYKECYITSYNFINSTQFWTYAQYSSVKQFISQQDGYVFIRKNAGYTDLRGGGYVCVMPRTVGVSFVGTSTQGSFTSVQPSINWQVGNVASFSSNTNLKWYQFDGNGNFTQVTNSISGQLNQTTANTASFTDSSRNTVFTSKDKNELVYVFPTLNALKNYNAGTPQPYYLTSSGMNTGTWTASGGGVINTGTMNNSGNYYNQVTNGVSSNWTPDQILALVDKVTNANSGSGGSSGESNENSKWWERIGNTIGNLIDGLVEVLSTVIEHLSDALLSVIHLLTGYTDDNGTVHEGLFGKLLNLVNSGFNNFLASIFSWLPEEIVTLFTAVLVFGIFFGLLKMLRR